MHFLLCSLPQWSVSAAENNGRSIMRHSVTVDADCSGVLHHGAAVGCLDGDGDLSCLWETSQKAVLQSQRRLQGRITTQLSVSSAVHTQRLRELTASSCAGVLTHCFRFYSWQQSTTKFIMWHFSAYSRTRSHCLLLVTGPLAKALGNRG